MKRLSVIIATLILCSCYNNKEGEIIEYSDTTGVADTAAYGINAETNALESGSQSLRRPYGVNYNFIVTADSIALIRQEPEEYVSGMLTDTVMIGRDERIVVADMRVIHATPTLIPTLPAANEQALSQPTEGAPTAPTTYATDSVWVQVARDQDTFGWIPESDLIRCTVPDDPVSIFIYTFSNAHLLITLVFGCIIAATYIIRKITKRRSKIVHFNDIASLYPTLLTLLVATTATLYSSIQMFAPAAWQYFYYNPTLYPLAHPPVIAAFLCAAWAIVLVLLAVLDVVNRSLPTGSALLYMLGLACVCAADYIVFSVTTLYYVGYVLLAAYYVFAIRRYIRHSLYLYVCGNCGFHLRHKGICPHCGAMNE